VPSSVNRAACIAGGAWTTTFIGAFTGIDVPFHSFTFSLFTFRFSVFTFRLSLQRSHKQLAPGYRHGFSSLERSSCGSLAAQAHRTRAVTRMLNSR
jgi:hypothetical protein